MTKALVELADYDDRADDGEAMKKLTDLQRKFVLRMVELGMAPHSQEEAARYCGYSNGRTGYALLRSEKIMAALHEEARKRLVGASLLGVSALVALAGNPQHKDHFQAARTLAAINGFSSEQKITVTHISQDQGTVVARIVEQARQLGVDPKPLLLSAGISEQIIDAEFEEVPTQEEDW